jgi:uncharacterized membrane protein YgcG
MLAYRRADFEARARAQAVAAWEDEGLINAAGAEELKQRFSDPFYEPNPFVRIGLFVFGHICAWAAMGLFFLIFSRSGSFGGRAVLTLTSGVVALGVAEMLARRPKAFFRAGVEEAMAYTGLGCALTGLFLLLDLSLSRYTTAALIIAAAAALASIRYADSLFALVAFAAALFALVATGKDLGDGAVSAMPFAVIAFAAAMVAACGWALRRKGSRPWEHVFDLLRLVGLLVAYAGGNYLVVREAGHALIGSAGTSGGPPLAFLFQAWTYAVPPAYMAYGLWKKDRQFLDAGLLLVAAAVGTYKYYHSVMPIEVGMILAGAALMLTAWAALKAFRPARLGITAAAAPRGAGDAFLNVEGLAKLHSSHGPEIPGKQPDGMDGGGGKFGGGGAQGTY